MTCVSRWSLSAQRATLSVKRGKCNGAVNGVVDGVINRVVDRVVDGVVDWETSRGSGSRQGLGLAEGR
jgi:hypothetical protein